MPKYGKIIARLRREQGMTQAELGAKLNVTYQAVSKWENDQSQPDFATMNELAKLFHVPLTSFLEESEETAATAAETAAPAPMSAAAPAEQMLGVCATCGRIVYESNIARREPTLMCQSCAAAEEKRRQEELLRPKREAEGRKLEVRHRRNVGLLWATGVTIVVLVLLLVLTFTSPQEEQADLLLGSIILTVLTFTFTSQMIWDGFVRDAFLFGGKVIGTPGIIFSFDWDGFIFLIGMKLLFAVLRLVVFLLTTVLIAIFAFVASFFTFIPSLIRVSLGREAD